MPSSLKLGFGCAPVMGKVGKSSALKAMGFAFERGVTHFDIARSYGFGHAESVLGHFSKGKRDKITITSKFGVVPPKLSMSKRLLIPAVREISNYVPGIKAKLKRKSGQLLADRRFDRAYAAQCLEASLKQLKTDYLDFYLLHEPSEETLSNLDELYTFLENQKAAGKILAYGTALKNVADVQYFSRGSVLQIEGNLTTYCEIQARLNEFGDRSLLVTRPFAGGEAIQSSALHGDFNRKCNIQLTPMEFALALSANIAGPDGTVITSMFSIEHVLSNVRTMSNLAASPEVVKKLGEFVKESLC